MIVGPGAGPQFTTTYNGQTGVPRNQFFPHGQRYGGAVTVGAVDLARNGKRDVMTLRGGRVSVFDGLTLGLVASFVAFAGAEFVAG